MASSWKFARSQILMYAFFVVAETQITGKERSERLETAGGGAS